MRQERVRIRTPRGAPDVVVELSPPLDPWAEAADVVREELDRRERGRRLRPLPDRECPARRS